MNRRTRRPRANQSIGRYREPVSMFGPINVNPNKGKRHTAPATARLHSLTQAERDAIKAGRRSYVPLAVTTPLNFDSAGRKLPEARRTESTYVV